MGAWVASLRASSVPPRVTQLETPHPSEAEYRYPGSQVHADTVNGQEMSAACFCLGQRWQKAASWTNPNRLLGQSLTGALYDHQEDFSSPQLAVVLTGQTPLYLSPPEGHSVIPGSTVAGNAARVKKQNKTIQGF